MGQGASKKIVLAYSGGLDTSVMLHWLSNQGYQVVAFCADVGQGNGELDGLVQKALQTGAVDAHVVDAKDAFAKDFVFTAVKAQAVYEGCYLMGTSLARPLIAQKQVEIARKVGATAVAHGATGKGNDQVRFELTFAALAPELEVMAPWRTWAFEGRGDLIAYATAHGIPVPVTPKKPYSMDRNLMHVSYEGGILEDPWATPPENMFQLTKSIDETPDNAIELLIDFEAGEPVRIENTSYSPAQLVGELNRLGGEHGVGRVDLVENRIVGLKSRGVYETPGVSILQMAHRALESITLDKHAVRLRDSLGVAFADIIYTGTWFSPEFRMLQTMLNEMQKPVTGTVRVQLHKGNVRILGRKAPNSLYQPALVSFEKAGGFNQADASGFIKLMSLRFKGASSHE